MEIGSVEYASRVKEYSERMKELEAERNELQGTAAKYAEVRLWLDTFIEQPMQSDTLTTVDGTTMKMLVCVRRSAKSARPAKLSSGSA